MTTISVNHQRFRLSKKLMLFSVVFCSLVKCAQHLLISFCKIDSEVRKFKFAFPKFKQKKIYKMKGFSIPFNVILLVSLIALNRLAQEMNSTAKMMLNNQMKQFARPWLLLVTLTQTLCSNRCQKSNIPEHS